MISKEQREKEMREYLATLIYEQKVVTLETWIKNDTRNIVDGGGGGRWGPHSVKISMADLEIESKLLNEIRNERTLNVERDDRNTSVQASV
jgi:hypothetical protein